MVDSVLRIPCRWLDNAFHDLFEVENGIFFSEDGFGADVAQCGLRLHPAWVSMFATAVRSVSTKRMVCSLLSQTLWGLPFLPKRCLAENGPQWQIFEAGQGHFSEPRGFAEIGLRVQAVLCCRLILLDDFPWRSPKYRIFVQDAVALLFENMSCI